MTHRQVATPAGVLAESAIGRTVEVYGAPVRFLDVGSGPPLVMLHAWGPGSSAWTLFSEALPLLSRHFRCIALDLPNYGGSGPFFRDAESLYSLQANCARDLMRTLDVERAHILGHSQGAQSALTFAALFPDAVDRLVVGGCHTGARHGEYLLGLGDEEGIRVAYPVLRGAGSEAMRRYLETCVADRRLVTDELVEAMLRRHAAREDLVAARRDARHRPAADLSDDMAVFEAPTLVIWGREDRTCGWEIGVRMFNIIPNARLVVLKGAGHWAPFERPREYAGHVAGFLTGTWADDPPPPRRGRMGQPRPSSDDRPGAVQPPGEP